jgi:hypothetical protein
MNVCVRKRTLSYFVAILKFDAGCAITENEPVGKYCGNHLLPLNQAVTEHPAVWKMAITNPAPVKPQVDPDWTLPQTSLLKMLL